DGTAPSAADEVHLDVVGIVHDAAHQVVHGVGDDLGVHLSAASADSPSSAFFSSAFASSAFASSASSAFLADFFLAVTASPTGALSASASAALNRSSLERLGSATFRVPSAPGRPLNFCQSPVTLSRLSTGSVGWAPTLSQYCTHSESMAMRLGSSLGRYRPMVSMARPLRRVRESATMTRY